MSKKVSGKHKHINRLQDVLSKEARLIAIQTLAMSHNSYGIAILGTTDVTQFSRVQKLQNFAARVARRGICKFNNVTPPLRELEWLLAQKIIYS